MFRSADGRRASRASLSWWCGRIAPIPEHVRQFWLVVHHEDPGHITSVSLTMEVTQAIRSAQETSRWSAQASRRPDCDLPFGPQPRSPSRYRGTFALSQASVRPPT